MSKFSTKLEIKDMGMTKILKSILSSDAMEMTVGVHGDSGSYRREKGNKIAHKGALSDSLDVANVAFKNEYGDLNHKPRPFLRDTFDSFVGNSTDFNANNLLNGSTNSGEWIASIGKDLTEKVKDKIFTNNYAPNPEWYVRVFKPGIGNKPLFRTGRMMDSVNYKIYRSKNRSKIRYAPTAKSLIMTTGTAIRNLG